MLNEWRNLVQSKWQPGNHVPDPSTPWERARSAVPWHNQIVPPALSCSSVAYHDSPQGVYSAHSYRNISIIVLRECCCLSCGRSPSMLAMDNEEAEEEWRARPCKNTARKPSSSQCCSVLLSQERLGLRHWQKNCGFKNLESCILRLLCKQDRVIREFIQALWERQSLAKPGCHPCFQPRAPFRFLPSSHICALKEILQVSAFRYIKK